MSNTADISRFAGALNLARQSPWGAAAPLIERYLREGDASLLAKLSPVLAKAHLFHFAQALGPPEQLDELDRRMLRLLAQSANVSVAVSAWASAWPTEDGKGEPALKAAVEAMRAAGFPQEAIDLGMIHRSASSPRATWNFAARYVIDLPEDRLSSLLGHIHPHMLNYVAALFVQLAPDRAGPVIDAAKSRSGVSSWLCQILCQAGRRFEKRAAEMFDAISDLRQKFEAGRVLSEHFPDRSKQPVLEVATKMLEQADCIGAEWMLKNYGNASLPTLTRYVQEHCAAAASQYEQQCQTQVLELALKFCGDEAIGLMRAALGANPNLRVAALNHLLDRAQPMPTDEIDAAIERGLSESPRTAARFVALAARRKQTFGARLWELLGRKQKLLRDASAAALVDDQQALDRAAGMLAERSKDARLGAVALLGHMASPQAAECLLCRLGREGDADVRDEMCRVLRLAGVANEKVAAALGPVDLAQLKVRAQAISEQAPHWLALQGLPLLYFSDGSQLTVDLTRYLVVRQARQTEPITDPESAPIYPMLDRHRSGDFAHALLSAFVAAGAPKTDAWALIVAGRLGDNRVITTLSTKVRSWTEANEHKLGTWGIEALALNGSDAALSSIYALAQKYKDNPRRKFKVVGEAAQEAIERAAKQLSVSLDDIADRVVPMLGFEPGKPRRIEAGGRVIEAMIGLDFKLSMKDAVTGKRAVSIPKAAPAQLQTEFKGLTKLLAEISKPQSARLQDLMVRRHRWSGRRFKELFLEHPVMFPFAVRVVWGSFDPQGELLKSFRALPDGTLTDAQDEPAEAGDADLVGIAHPLDLPADLLAAWRQHFADYEIQPPFTQLERPIARVTAGTEQSRSYDALKGAKLNGLSFRSKLEHSGWVRGTPGDGGLIASYRKRFAADRIDAFAVIEGLPAYHDPSAVVTMGEVVFLPLDTTPRDFHQKVVPLGQVPQIVFSEAAGDLLRIFGRNESGGG